MNGWNYIKAHPMPASSVSALPDVHTIALDLWNELNHQCHFNEIDLDVEYDDTIGDREILAYASRTLFLEGDRFVSGALSKEGYLGSVRIRVNPNVPNGWYVDDGTCDSGYRYDLKTVLRHELLHGVGVSSSITPEGAGYYLGSHCYPTMFDTLVENEQHEKVVDGCMHTHTSGHSYYVGDVKLYNPPSFNLGSSMSHADAQGLMWYSVPPMTCIGYDENVWKFLRALNASCNVAIPEPIVEAESEPEPEPEPEPESEPEPEPEPESEPEPEPEPELESEPEPVTRLGNSGARVKLSIYISALLVVKWWMSLSII